MPNPPRPSLIPENWRSLSPDALREVFRKDRESAGIGDIQDDPQLVGLSYEEGAAVIAGRIRDRLASGALASELESKYLLAIIEDRPKEIARLSDVLDRRNLLGLSVVKGGKPVQTR